MVIERTCYVMRLIHIFEGLSELKRYCSNS